MVRALTIGAGVGVLVALLWATYAALTFPTSMQAQPAIWDLAQITCPIAFASAHFHFGINLYWAVLANATTYAVVAFVARMLRRQLRHV